MKRILILCLILCLGLCSCNNENNLLAKLDSLPNEFYKYDNGLLLQVDYANSLNYPQALYKPTDALYYENDALIQLKPYDTEIVLKDDITTTNTEIKLPIRYYIYNKSVRAYFSVDRKELPTTVFLRTIPNDETSIIIYDALVKRPIIYNLKDNTYSPIFSESEYNNYLDCISDDGKYTVILTPDNKSNTNKTKWVIVNLQNKKAIDIALPDDGRTFTINPICFIENKFLFKLSSFNKGETSYNFVGLYKFDINNNSLSLFNGGAFTDFSEYYKQNSVSSTVITASSSNSFSVHNLKTNKHYVYSFEQPTNFALITNSSGEYCYGSYAYLGGPAGYDEDNEPFYKTPDSDDYKKIVINLKNNNEIDIINHLKYDKKSESTFTDLQWLSETAILITYINGTAPNVKFHNEIIDLKTILEVE